MYYLTLPGAIAGIPLIGHRIHTTIACEVYHYPDFCYNLCSMFPGFEKCDSIQITDFGKEWKHTVKNSRCMPPTRTTTDD